MSLLDKNKNQVFVKPCFVFNHDHTWKLCFRQGHQDNHHTSLSYRILREMKFMRRKINHDHDRDHDCDWNFVFSLVNLKTCAWGFFLGIIIGHDSQGLWLLEISPNWASTLTMLSTDTMASCFGHSPFGGSAGVGLLWLAKECSQMQFPDF